MKDTASAFHFDLTKLDRPSWTRRVEGIADEFGHADPIGPNHMAVLIDAGRTLLVTFESVAGIRRQNDDTAPLGWGFVQTHGWSSMTILSEVEQDWYRSPAIYGYFDRLIDDGFFDDFDQVLFYGAGAAGYAAAAFSVSAPDARVLLIQPQATLDPRLARWDRRTPEARRFDFTSRFGYAPQMVETADTVWVVHDPTVIEDGMHASLFNGDNTHHMTCPYLGPNADRSFAAMDILPDMIEQAMDGTLNTASYAELWRARQTYPRYLRTLLHRLEADDDHDRLLARLCRKVSENGRRPLFAEKLKELEARGVKL